MSLFDSPLNRLPIVSKSMAVWECTNDRTLGKIRDCYWGG